MSYTFRPSRWAVAGMLAGCAAFIALGFWQIHRGQQKKLLIEQYEAAAQAAPAQLNSQSTASNRVAAGAAHAEGRYISNRQVLLDGQVHHEVPGFEVLTPLRMADGGLLLVNRGWIPQPTPRTALPPLPAPTADIQVQGLWRSLPRPAMRLGDGACAEGHAPEASAWPLIVEYPTAEDLRCLYGEPVAAGELLLSKDAPDGYVRDWLAAPSEMPPSRHYGYAAQWFAFAATLFGLFLKLNLKRKPKPIP